MQHTIKRCIYVYVGDNSLIGRDPLGFCDHCIPRPAVSAYLMIIAGGLAALAGLSEPLVELAFVWLLQKVISSFHAK